MLIAYSVSLDLVRALRPIVSLIEEHDRDEAKQLISSASSIVRNLAEGNRRRGGDRMRFFSYAEGSASEVRGSVELAIGWGWIADGGEALAIVDRLMGLIWGLTHRRDKPSDQSRA